MDNTKNTSPSPTATTPQGQTAPEADQAENPQESAAANAAGPATDVESVPTNPSTPATGQGEDGIVESPATGETETTGTATPAAPDTSGTSPDTPESGGPGKVDEKKSRTKKKAPRQWQTQKGRPSTSLHAVSSDTVDSGAIYGDDDKEPEETESLSGCDSCALSTLIEKIPRQPLTWPGKEDGAPCPWEIMNGKPVLYRDVKTVLNLKSEDFHEKLLCDALTMNLGDACGFTCWYCYVEPIVRKLVARLIRKFNLEYGTSFEHQGLVIRRWNVIPVLLSQVLKPDGTPKFNDPNDQRTVYSATLVDAAANKELLLETAAACNVILKYTNWQIRLLSKSAGLVDLIKKELIPKEYHHRLILGFSIGTLDDGIARAIEPGTSSPTARLKAHRWLQDHGIRTFGMICPSLPQKDYGKFSMEICAALRIEKCEHVWAEVINVRGKNRPKTISALRNAGYEEEAKLLESVFVGKDAKKNWEKYSRDTFLAHTRNIPVNKLRFLQYVTKDSIQWWADRRDIGAVPIGPVAKKHLLLAGGESAPREPLPDLTNEDVSYRKEREDVVHTGIRASIAAARALHEIYTYKNGLLWKKGYLSFDLYCQANWGYSSQHGGRLIDTGRFVAEIEDSTNHATTDADDTQDAPQPAVPLPVNEGQIRPLLQAIPAAHQVACWTGIVEKHDPANLTSAMVEDFAKAYAKANNLESGKKTRQPRVTDHDRALRVIEHLCEILEKLPEPKRFEQLLFGLRTLVNQDPADNTIDIDSEVVDPPATGEDPPVDAA